MARGQGQPPVAGASGDVRNITSNVGGTKRDRQMDTASESGLGTTTGSEAADDVIEQRAADEADGAAADARGAPGTGSRDGERS